MSKALKKVIGMANKNVVHTILQNVYSFTFLWNGLNSSLFFWGKNESPELRSYSSGSSNGDMKPIKEFKRWIPMQYVKQ